MREAADNLEYERAARVRDRLASVRKAIERQQMVAERNEDLDVIGIAEDDLEAGGPGVLRAAGPGGGAQGLRARQGRGRHPGELVGDILERLYDDPPLGVPEAVLVPTEPDDPELYEDWLTQLRGLAGRGAGAAARAPSASCRPPSPATPRGVHPPPAAAGQRPQRPGPGAQRAAGRARAARCPAAHRVLRHEPHPGHRLRRLDGGDGGRLPKKSDYRRFKVRAVPGNDDFAAMEEVLTRRLTAYLDERASRWRAHRQVRLPAPAAAGRTAARASSTWPCGCSRTWGSTRRSRWRRWPSGSRRSTCRASPTRCGSPRVEALYLLQRIRDEAHRFAITYHRQLRGKRMTTSVLDDIKGLGPARRKRLTKELGGVAAVKRASLDDLRALSWLPDDVADAVYDKIHRRPAGPVP